MITIYINDKPSHLETSCSLYDLLSKNHHVEQHVAIAINNQFIPRLSYTTTMLQEGDRVDLIVPMQGG